ncbi:MAG: protein phosphatase CheZ, partial [Methylococcales bacterium]
MPEEFVVADVLENDDSNDELLAKRLESARALVTALEQGNEKSADKIVYEIASASETKMFQQVGQLTRQLHEAMSGFAQDSRLGELTENAIPDAKERLNYVITMTQQAADTTLNVVDELLPVSDRLVDQAGELSVRWNRFLQKEMP